MSRQNEAHGDEDMKEEPTARHLELALEEIIECIFYNGGYPAQGRRQFDLYDYLIENRDPSYAWEMFVAAMSDNSQALENRITREQATVEAMLIKHLTDTDMVADLAAEIASGDE